MTCDRMAELMSALPDRGVDEHGEMVAAHLHSCVECRRLWNALQTVDALMRASPRLQAPAGFVARTVVLASAQKRRDSIFLGLLILLWGALITLAFTVVSAFGLSGIALALLGLPTVLSAESLSLGVDVLVSAGRLGWALLSLLRELVTMPPIALMMLLSLGGGLAVLAVLMRTGQRPAPSLL